MKYLLILALCIMIGSANDTNSTKKDSNTTKVIKKDTNISKKKVEEENIKKQMQREEKYAKEQKFYMGKDYDLKAHEVDEKTLNHIQSIEPDYDFDITDVYRDDQ